jgi:acyl-CoA synthetase (AMP-forming)/AMP-acid ligase II
MYLLHDIFEWRATIAPDAEVQRDGTGRIMLHGELEELSNRFANGLIAAGVGVGDRVAVVSKNTLEFLVWTVGTSKAGAVLVPLNFRLTPAELTQLINDAEAKVLVGRGDLVNAIALIRFDLKSVELALAIDADVPEGWVDHAAWIGRQSVVAPGLDLGTQADALQLYTSGTTGLPKGAVMTHANTTVALHQLASTGASQPGARLLVVAPLFHVGGLFGALYTVAGGGTLYVMEEFIPAEVVRVLDEEDIDFTFMAGAMIQALLAFVPDVADRKYERLDTMCYGAAPMTVETLTRAMEVFGCKFAQGFGQTEAGGAATFLSAEDHRRALAGDRPEVLLATGRATLATQIKIVDEGGATLGPNEPGEILVKGPQVMRGFWRNPVATKEAFADGWLRTGDVGYLDHEGYLYIKDRLKDMIVSGGENVYPVEVERVLYAHPAVGEAAVIGVPNDRWGEAVHAVVVLRPDAEATSEELIAHAKASLAGYKAPQSVEFVEELPKNASMKVLKRELRAPYWAGHNRQV